MKLKHFFYVGLLTAAAPMSFGQTLTLTVPSLGGPYSGASSDFTTPLSTPITIGSAPGGAVVTLATTDYLFLTTSSTSCTGATQSLPITTPSSGTASVYVCLENLVTGGTFSVLVSATASGYTPVSQAATFQSFPGGSVTVNPQSENVPPGESSSLPEIKAVNFSGGQAGPIVVNATTFAPNLPTSWLNPLSSNDLTCTDNTDTDCTIQVTVNPNASGLVEGVTYTAAITFLDSSDGNVAPLIVNYLYSGSASTSPPLTFVPVPPCRVVDTRVGVGAFGPPILAAGQTREFDIPSGPCSGIPSSAVAYSLNVTVVPTNALSYLTIWAAGGAQPVVSTLNSDGRIKANAAVVGAGNNGGVDVFVTDQTHLVLDINGYFEPATSSGLAFYKLDPCRVMDTRGEAGVVIAGGYLSAGETRTVPILSSSCGLPSTAQAYALNVTAVPHTGLSYLKLWPTGLSQPNVSTLNSPGSITANAAILPAGTDGSFDVFASDDTDLVVDVNGYFGPTGGANGLRFYSIPVCRAEDTRPTFFVGERDFDLSSSSCNIPSTAQIELLNVTAVPQAGLSYLTLWQQGPPRPTVSTLNGGQAIVSNMAMVPVNTSNGQIAAYATDSTALVFDVSGYFAP